MTLECVVIPLLFLFVSIPYPNVATSLNVSNVCNEEERMALLKFREGLTDPANCLSSWVDKDQYCCNWKGIECDNHTGHVQKLDLKSCSISTISGELNISLTNLKYLTYLDLSYNDFLGIPIPDYIGSLSMLHYLDLSNSNFSGMVPSNLGNLFNLHYLHISKSFSPIWVIDLSWLSTLSSLQYLHMESVIIKNTSHEWFQAINMIPYLIELSLSSCNLHILPQSFPFSNITSLSLLDLSSNNFTSSIPSWLFNNISTLTELFLSASTLIGPFPKLERGNLCMLQSLDLTDNDNLNGDISEMLEVLSLCKNHSLERLDLSNNHITGKLPLSLGKFNNLYHLDLSYNSLWGSIPASIANLSKINYLNLQDNLMNGTIPDSIGQLTQMKDFNLQHNFWEGTMTKFHFYNLTNLNTFYISSKNNSLALKISNDWVPPFKKLYHVEIHDCEVGPTFPSFLRNQTILREIIIQNAGISAEIPNWLYNMASQIWQLDLSHNKISGYLPKELNFSSDVRTLINLNFNQLKGSIPLFYTAYTLLLSNNLLSGTIPANIGHKMSQLMYVDLSNNHLNGSIPLSIDRIQDLSYLDLSNNYLVGEIPMFWRDMQRLETIDLSYNSFSGQIPTSICSLPNSLSIIDLSNNNLSADLSSAFQNCTWLKTLDLSNNRFFGSLPKEITKNLPSLSELQLRENAISGSIPEELCGLPFLHLLDVSNNNLSESIPACFGGMHGFKLPQTYYNINNIDYSLSIPGYVPYNKHIKLVLKGTTYEYIDQMLVQSIIDLSNNHLSGDIPENLTKLLHLGALNLSWNHFTGTIPKSIGSLTDLEALDLSNNNLSGPIPPSMTSLTFLSYLNLSYNNLYGQIPEANQFGTFTDPSIYEGNSELCGKPLTTNCSSLLPSHESNEEEETNDADDDDKSERLWLYVSIAVGFISGFWFVCGSLVLNRSWRHAYFKLVYDTGDKFLVLIAVNLARAKCRFGPGRN
ncbi:hypothetical protein TanjilG_06591 [Lupinus angustifolius]|uniref:Uncharacterized protein n=1 Tax=Lupinus angustifolius TaxID=3871 RepID=A0A394D9K2_LUPAN|nr:PREDICTED: LRR receptor-like serine/threonine-protein kinase GSO2 [Lupinus angustifolius]OIW20190.1 hypothetical protein TanjilG_06591 [Lupinus angustifolius]